MSLQSAIRWYSKRAILHLNMLCLVVDFVLKIEIAISKNRTTHLHFGGFYGVSTCYPSGHIWYKTDFRTLPLDEIFSFAWFSHRKALKCLSHRKPCNIKKKNVTKLISVRKKSYTFSKYLMPSILKYIIHISYIFSFSL